jgi:NAD(P)-dependent dehydrogenase (short-subunit alcohol dehydrogenase family)
VREIVDWVDIGMREDDLRTCLKVLSELAEAPPGDPDLGRVRQAVTAFLKRTRQNERTRERRQRAQADAATLAATATGAADRTEGAPVTPRDASGLSLRINGRINGQLNALTRCYVCKAHFREVDAFYHRLCPPCAEENRRRRDARADLTGRRAIVTGGRVKAGFELVLKLLRDGAAVTALTRFPHDARRRFAAVHDHDEWRDRLTVTGMDLRHIPAVLRWCDDQVAAGEPLDILVNLAAQTVRPPAEAYAALQAIEQAAERAGASLADEPGPPPRTHLPATLPRILMETPLSGTVRTETPRTEETSGTALSGTAGAEAPLSALPEASWNETLLPAGVDVSGLIPDPSPANSWTRLVHEVDPVELLEVQLINVTAPFLLLGRLRPLMQRSPHRRRYVVNVSAVEGQFDRTYKGPEHPHTNMAKASLNMLTRTSADELAAHGVYLTSVDPGWFSDQQPDPDRRRRAEAGFRPPLDVVDAAARVYDPIVRGEAGDPPYGCLLKDYRVAPW